MAYQEYGGTQGAVVDLTAGTATDTFGDIDTLVNIDHITGSNMDDQITGNDRDNQLVGRDGDDVIYGGAGDDELSAQSGDDRLFGGAGDDSLWFGYGTDYVDGGDGFDTYSVWAGWGDMTLVDYELLGDGQTRLSFQHNGNGQIHRQTLKNIEQIQWNGQTYTVESIADEVRNSNYFYNLEIVTNQPGDEAFVGRSDINNGLDLRIEGQSTGGARVENGQISYANNVDVDTFSNIQLFIGTEASDTWIGTDTDNTVEFWRNATDNVIENYENFQGCGGNDVLDGRGGYDEVSFTSATAGVIIDLALTMPQIDGQGGADTLLNIEGIEATRFDDVLYGTDGDNGLDGRLGNNTIDGRGGFDVVEYNGRDRVEVRVDLANGEGQFKDSNGNSYTDTLVNIEGVVGSDFKDELRGDDNVNLLAGGRGDDRLEGRGGDDRLLGGEGHDWLYGGAGDDQIDGGEGWDRIDFRGETSGVTVDLQTGTATGASIGTDTLVNIERVIGSENDDTLLGNDDSNSFSGSGGNDTIDGRGGWDYLWMGRMQSAVEVDLTAETVSYSIGDTDYAYTLRNVEQITGSNFADNLLGSDADEEFQGDAVGDNWTPNFRLGGADLIDGAGGVDTVSYSYLVEGDEFTPTGVVVNLSTGTAQDGAGNTDTLRNIENVEGSDFNDSIRGDDHDNRLDGRDGDDQFSSSLGNDRVFGGDGDDIYRLAGGDRYESEIVGGAVHIATFDGANQQIATVELVDVEQIQVNGQTFETANFVQAFPLAFDGVLTYRDSGVAMKGYELIAKGADGQELGRATTDDQGRFLFEADVAGFVSMTVASPDLSPDPVRIGDVISQLRHIVGLSPLDGHDKAAADVNGDGDVSISDVIGNLRHIVAWIPSTKCAFLIQTSRPAIQ